MPADPQPENAGQVSDPVTRYGFRRTPAGRVECADCLQTFPPEGAVMRSHARHCPINPRSFPIPGVCDA